MKTLTSNLLKAAPLAFGLSFFFACSGENGTDGTDGADGVSCYTKELKDKSGFKIICGEDSVGVLKNGIDGEDGKDGATGKTGKTGADGEDGEDCASCTVEQISSGFKVICYGDSIGVLKNGVNGTNGKNGESCTVARNEKDDGAVVTCGKTKVDIKDGATGADGDGCSVTSTAMGATVTCESGEGITTASISNGQNCSVADNGDGTVSITCDNSVDLYKAMCGTTPYDPELAWCDSKNQIWKLCDGKTYDPTREFCDHENKKTVDFCFKSKTLFGETAGKLDSFDLATEFCFGLISTNQDTVLYKCENDKGELAIYDTTTHFCDKNLPGTAAVTNGTIFEKCGEKVYDITKQFCNEGTIVNSCDINGNGQYDAGSEEIDPLKEFCYTAQDGKKSIVSLCGNTTYTNSQFCANNVVYNKCNGEEWDTETQVCITKTTPNYVYAKDLKCGSAVMDTDKQFCHNGKLYDYCDGMELSSSTPSCAKTVYYTYDPTTQYCGTVFTRMEQKEYRSFILDANRFKHGCTQSTLKSLLENDPAGGYTYEHKGVGDLEVCGSTKYVPVDTMCDKRNTMLYPTVKVGDAVWMNKNLTYNNGNGTGADGKPYVRSWCQTGDEGCKTNGRYYTWAAAMDSSEANPYGFKVEAYPAEAAKHQGVCPSGWHLPNSTEAQTLIDVLKGGSNDVNLMKDTTAFSSNGQQDYFSSGTLRTNTGAMLLWTSTSNNASFAIYLLANSSRTVVFSAENNKKTMGLSVRCVKDQQFLLPKLTHLKAEGVLPPFCIHSE